MFTSDHYYYSARVIIVLLCLFTTSITCATRLTNCPSGTEISGEVTLGTSLLMCNTVVFKPGTRLFMPSGSTIYMDNPTINGTAEEPITIVSEGDGGLLNFGSLLSPLKYVVATKVGLYANTGRGIHMAIHDSSFTGTASFNFFSRSIIHLLGDRTTNSIEIVNSDMYSEAAVIISDTCSSLTIENSNLKSDINGILSVSQVDLVTISNSTLTGSVLSSNPGGELVIRDSHLICSDRPQSGMNAPKVNITNTIFQGDYEGNVYLNIEDGPEELEFVNNVFMSGSRIKTLMKISSYNKVNQRIFISNNDFSGVQVSGDFLIISNAESQIHIEDNQFPTNVTGYLIKSLTPVVNIQITGNHFEGNEHVIAYLSDMVNSPKPINASYNYWGTPVEEQDIISKIHNGDTMTEGWVQFSPVLDADGNPVSLENPEPLAAVEINVETVWDSDKNITGLIINAPLTINAGVVVQVTAGGKIIANAPFRVLGTKTNRVVFKCQTGNHRFWKGMTIDVVTDDAGYVLSHVDILNLGSYGGSYDDGSKHLILVTSSGGEESILFDSISIGPILVIEKANNPSDVIRSTTALLNLKDSYFADCGTMGLTLSGSAENQTLSISGNTILNAGDIRIEANLYYNTLQMDIRDNFIQTSANIYIRTQRVDSVNIINNKLESLSVSIQIQSLEMHMENVTVHNANRFTLWHNDGTLALRKVVAEVQTAAHNSVFRYIELNHVRDIDLRVSILQDLIWIGMNSSVVNGYRILSSIDVEQASNITIKDVVGYGQALLSLQGSFTNFQIEKSQCPPEDKPAFTVQAPFSMTNSKVIDLIDCHTLFSIYGGGDFDLRRNFFNVEHPDNITIEVVPNGDEYPSGVCISPTLDKKGRLLYFHRDYDPEYFNACRELEDGYVCDGIESNDTAVCNSVGKCIDDSCVCPEGWTNVTCQTPTLGNALFRYKCNRISEDDESVCSGRGSCVLEDVCICDEGYSAYGFCSPVCYGVNSNNDTVCSGHGSCTQPNNCSCDAWYTGIDCSERVESTQSSAMSSDESEISGPSAMSSSSDEPEASVVVDSSYESAGNSGVVDETVHSSDVGPSSSTIAKASPSVHVSHQPSIVIRASSHANADESATVSSANRNYAASWVFMIVLLKIIVLCIV
jgi:hypothetical protein